MYLRTKFQVSSIILTDFRQAGAVILPPPAPPHPTPVTAKRTSKKPNLISVKLILDSSF